MSSDSNIINKNLVKPEGIDFDIETEANDDEEYTGACYWCGLCSETNGVCVRNNQALLSKTKKRY